MKPLATEFTKDGWHFRQIDRQGRIVTFEKTKGKAVSYEVVIVQQRKACEIDGRAIPAHEAMPSSESWGCLGYTYTDRSGAFSRVERLVTAQNRLQPPCKVSLVGE